MDARDFFKEARRRLGLLGKEGFDLFGNNKLFAPRIKWEALKDVVENLREIAITYEDAYNQLSETIEAEGSFEQIAGQMSAVAGKQVEAEKKRLQESQLIAESEKRLYVKAIGEEENRMEGLLANIKATAVELITVSRFNEDDLLAVLQAVCGFASAVVTKDPLGLVDAALGVAFTGERKCPLGTLENNAEKLKKWLTFGKSYQALEDSSDLDFDQVDVESVPEVMQANLEMNKEGLAADLVCLLEVQSRPQDAAELKKLIEHFFISGAARIDLIAKVMDLDNDLGGLIFDIPLLEETEKALTTLTEPTDTPILNRVRSEFMENLLGIYQELEGSFMKEVYGLYKAFRFRTLWETENPLPEFQRVASEGAQGKTLNGIIELTNVLRDIQNMETTAVKCFTNNIYTTDIQKWSFTQESDSTIFNGLHNGGITTFNIRVTDSCPTCFNIRLLKLYVELTGDVKQPDNVPLPVHLHVRHLSASFFRSGDRTIKEFRQPLGSFRKMKFRRSAISNEGKCGEEEEKGNKNSIYCVTRNDDRWQGMCSLSALDDILLGEEECRSPFGTYELVIPVDDQLSCDDPGITDKNCRDLNLSRFTTMNVWAQFYYWSAVYPTGPDDRACLSPVPPGVI
ncbi:hypothetical protein OS493_034360 [Desmophyllum pertusum]|uniref:Uncharacterized protein n=1 Tax=Desmophyllum pertusum TaxID=174260 RepID=A0A9W9YB33_9CNID|nr:hypothetical protein OS493_034360 [Desmophyllum pertusum]